MKPTAPFPPAAAPTAASDRVLFVDDDPHLLAACERNFRRRFQLETAEGGEPALARLATHGPYAVVISDMQMPRMDGVQFLSTVKDRAPDTVRIMLTGNANLETAIKVVNEGNIFRFLTKPCPHEVLGKALEDGLAQYRLVIAEKELLNQTLSGSIKLLTDILALFDSQSFGRTETMRDVIAGVTDKLGLSNAWEIHLAVMLAPIGLVTVPPETLIKARSGQALSKVEEQMLARVPETAARLLANIPRLEGVGRIVRFQEKHFDGSGPPTGPIAGPEIPLGARLLRILVDMLQVQRTGRARLDALAELGSRQGWYDPELLAAVRGSFGGSGPVTAAPRANISISAKDLAPGMVLHSDVLTKDGMLILSAGHLINEMTLEKIQNFERLSGIQEPIFVQSPEITTA